MKAKVKVKVKVKKRLVHAPADVSTHGLGQGDGARGEKFRGAGRRIRWEGLERSCEAEFRRRLHQTGISRNARNDGAA